MQTELDYSKIDRVIHGVAWRISHATGVEQDELYAEGRLAVLAAAPRYNYLCGKASTFVHTVAERRMRRFAKKQARLDMHAASADLVDHRGPDRRMLFGARMQELTLPGRRICMMVLADSDRFDGMNIARLSAHLRDKGWSWNTIWSGVRTVKAMLRSC